MDPGEPFTETRDEHYELVSALHHALKGADNCGIYLMDAEAAGREDLVAFFREARETQTELAEQAKGFLGIVPGGTTFESPGSGVAPPGEVPPRTGDAPPSPSEPPSL